METLGDALDAARSRRFVGRAAELEVFRRILGREDPARVLVVHGPAGVGKSTLLQAFVGEAAAAGRRCVAVDLRTVEPRPGPFLDELTAAGLTTSEPPGPVLVTVDTFERAAALEGWLRQEWLPSLRGDALVAIAGREPLSSDWRRDPGWAELLRVVALRNLTNDEVHTYLELAGVDASANEQAVALTHGHALAVSLLAEVLRQRPGDTLQGLADAPHVLASLVAGFLDGVPDRLHERVLQVCAHAWTTTEDLLAEVLEVSDAASLLRWLRRLSFIDEGPYGVFPHDLARDALDADLRWRDPRGYTALHRAVQQATLARARSLTGADQQRAIMHLVFAHRHSPLTSAYWDYAALGQVYADALRPTDGEHLVAMTARLQGEEQAALVAHWVERQPGAFRVVWSVDPEPVGFLCLLRLDLCDDDDRARDPAVDRALRTIAHRRPLRPGDHGAMLRFLVDAELDQRPSRTLNLGPVMTIQMVLSDPAVAWDLLCFADTGAMDPLMEFIDYARLPDATYEIGGRAYAVFGHDFRRRPAEEWFDLLAIRELGEPVSVAAQVDDVALAFPEFAAAVKDALRELHRPERLRRNPLVHSSMVHRAGGEGGATLAALIREQLDALRAEPRGAGLAAVLDRTYVRAAATQEAAAQVLDLPFSTYRRHLAKATDRLVERLWDLEL